MKAYVQVYDDFLGDRLLLVMRSIKSTYKNWSATPISIGELHEADLGKSPIPHQVNKMENEHRVYWESTLWC